jgi:hypothetical protein
MATVHEQQARRSGLRSWGRGRWLLIAGLLAVIVVAVVLVLVYTGGESGGGY